LSVWREWQHCLRARSVRCWRSTRTRTGVHWPYGRQHGSNPHEREVAYGEIDPQPLLPFPPDSAKTGSRVGSASFDSTPQGSQPGMPVKSWALQTRLPRKRVQRPNGFQRHQNASDPPATFPPDYPSQGGEHMRKTHIQPKPGLCRIPGAKSLLPAKVPLWKVCARRRCQSRIVGLDFSVKTPESAF
jgi:hypothetical protein